MPSEEFLVADVEGQPVANLAENSRSNLSPPGSLCVKPTHSIVHLQQGVGVPTPTNSIPSSGPTRKFSSDDNSASPAWSLHCHAKVPDVCKSAASWAVRDFSSLATSDQSFSGGLIRKS